jgi:hypothetical protein
VKPEEKDQNVAFLERGEADKAVVPCRLVEDEQNLLFKKKGEEEFRVHCGSPWIPKSGNFEERRERR